MKQLTGMDATFLYMESPNTYGHINGLGIYRRPDDPDFRPFDAVRAQIESRIHLLEPFRRRLVEVPLGLDHPYWVNDADFDIEFHLRHIAIPAPGDQEQLAAQVARIISRPMDRTKPLWEAYVMEGLERDEFALLTKFHHATIDGASGVEMLTMLLDADPAGDEIPPDDGSWRPDSMPSDVELLGRTAGSFLRRPYRLARFQLDAAQQVARITRNRGLDAMVSMTRRALPAPWSGAQDDRDLPPRPAVRAPRTPFNGAITAHRRLAMRTVPLDDIKRLKQAAGATVNDIVMAVCAGALRRYLELHGELPDQPLQAMVPVSVRTGQEADRWTNRVSALVVPLATADAEPLARIETSRAAMDQAKGQFEMVPADTLTDLANFSSPALAAQASRLASTLNLADRTTPPVNVIISNVPGPRQPLYLAGAQLQRYIPVSTIADGVGLNITVHSYLDRLDIGLVACRELVPDLELLVDLHVQEIDAMAEALGVELDSAPTAPKKAEPSGKTASKKPGTKKKSQPRAKKKKTQPPAKKG